MSNNKWKGNFFLIWIGQSVSHLTSAILQFAFVWYLTDKTKSAMVLSISMIIVFLPKAIMGSFIGAFIDKYDRKKIMIYSDLFVGVVSLVIVLANFFGSIPIWLIYIVLFFRSVGSTVHEPTLQAVTPQIVPKDELFRCASYSQTLESFSGLLSPGIAAVLYSIFRLNAFIWIDILGMFIAIIALQFAKIPSIEKTSDDIEILNIFKESKKSFKLLGSQKGLMKLVFISTIYSLAMMPISAFFPLMSMDFFNGTSYHAGFVEVVFAVGLIVGSILLGKLSKVKNKINLIIFSFITMGTSLMLSGFLNNKQFNIFLLLAFFMGLSGPFFWGIYTALLQQGFKKENLGRVLALSKSITVIASPIGMLSSGIFAETFGLSNCFIISSVVVFMSALICVFEKDIQQLKYA